MKTVPAPLLWLLLAILAAGGCQAIEEVFMEPFRGETPHERYGELLDRSGLGETALARVWKDASLEALRHPAEAVLPMTEEGWFAPETPTAIGVRIELERGQRLSVDLAFEDMQTLIFIEVFRLRGAQDPDDPSLLSVAWADSLARSLTYDASVTGSFIVRVQPELLGGGAWELSMQVGASLAFPVEGARLRDIGSFFGAARDGGVRQHHGVDIFAPRGTPVLAASDGIVRRARETPVGGLNVWLRNEARGHSEYYAHLDRYVVEAGDRVREGDTIGFVGNTGNAITTPPHLHFGIYERGPVDPLPWLRDPGGSPAPLAVDRSWFHERAFLTGQGVTVRSAPATGASTLARIDEAMPVRVMAGNGRWLRVRLPDGRAGFVTPDELERSENPASWDAASRRMIHADS